MNFVEAMTTDNTVTENRMPTHSTSDSKVLDLFYQIGAARALSDEQIIRLFSAALAEDKNLALKTMFHARNIRGGCGERRVFRVMLRYLGDYAPEDIGGLVHLIGKYGRYDDLFVLFGTEAERFTLEVIKNQLDIDFNALLANKPVSLLGKWLPRKGQHADKIRRYLGLRPSFYRKRLVSLTKVVETQMCAREWSVINYNHVPSQAAKIYRKAFLRNDHDRYSKYLAGLKTGKTKVNAGAVYPHEIIKSYVSGNQVDALLEAQWQSLPNYMTGGSILPVCDVSGSMVGLPMDVSIALGIYCSERNDGPFKDCFITFSSQPELQKLNGNLSSRIRQLSTANWSMNTNLEAVFTLIIKQAIKHNLKQEDMPKMLLILSDMQFDQCIVNPDKSANKMLKSIYECVGYEPPRVVFWNLRAVLGQSPVKLREDGTALVSGFSPAILKTILASKSFNPYSIMLDTLEKYSDVQGS